jgi:hypothetical protein
MIHLRLWPASHLYPRRALHSCQHRAHEASRRSAARSGIVPRLSAAGAGRGDILQHQGLQRQLPPARQRMQVCQGPLMMLLGFVDR